MYYPQGKYCWYLVLSTLSIPVQGTVSTKSVTWRDGAGVHGPCPKLEEEKAVFKLHRSCVFTFLILLIIGLAQGGVISDPTDAFSVGIGPDGSLYDAGAGVGFLRIADGYDPLAPGSPRDSWGIYGVGVGSAFADPEDFGTSGVSSTSTFSANTASFVSTTTNGYTVAQSYVFADANILAIVTTVTNAGSTTQDTVFQRDIDWDVFPTEFNENSFGPAVSGNVIDSTSDGFQNPDPSAPYGSSCATGCNNTGDNGGGIKIDLGTLAPGQSTTFTYLYGISQTGENVNGLIAQVNALGAYYDIATQSSDGGAFPLLGTNSAIIAVAESPEPETFGFIGMGLALIGLRVVRKRNRD
jgi:hypothetical protein